MTMTSLREYRLNREVDEPLWQQLATALRTAIHDKVLQPDQALPSEVELIDMYGVSRTVVREALADLVRRGLIYKIRAKGSFVSPKRPDLAFVGSTSGSLDDLTAAGHSSSTRVLSQEEGAANESEARALNIDLGAPVARLRRLRTVDETPWLLVQTTIPLELCPGVVKANLENRSLYEYLRRHYAIEVSGADRWLQPVLPEPEEAELLELSEGEPVLAIESIAWDAEDRRFEYYQALHRSGATRFYVGIRN
ncbi:GntR family transcriptional regulator [Paramicrobacterium agarici]|uniref:GntR family transcriptional regulator n=1 Tax=Paramicrobacterium agarici TaxID=630514 RepID=A0A2A9DSV8_9MICO|nr:GntR family transcriptional regulator [Microbacterium agarici]PFG29877.1 GntR family transcriptional regulator [Microbacterium agarici]